MDVADPAKQMAMLKALGRRNLVRLDEHERDRLDIQVRTLRYKALRIVIRRPLRATSLRVPHAINRGTGFGLPFHPIYAGTSEIRWYV